MAGRKFALPLTVAAILAATGVIACRAQTAATPVNTNKKTTPMQKVPPVTVTVTTDKKVYAVGEPIKLTLTARNTTKEAVHLTFSSGQKYDFEIRRGAKSDGPLIWQWAHGKMFIQMLTGDTLEASKTQDYKAEFDPAKPTGAAKPAPLTPGTYTVSGTLTILPQRERPSGIATFRVK